LVSAGSTGATMTAALFALKRIKGVHRPALAAQVPIPGGTHAASSASRPGAAGGTMLFLDVGANTEVRPQHLIQFAYLGSAFSESVLDVERPRVALLSVGEEQKKGNPDVVEAHAALEHARTRSGGRATDEGETINFIGNVEGRDLLTGAADVIVTDGFTGNVTLKTLEGTARAVAGAVRDAARSGPIAAAGGLLLRLRGVAVVAHGSSTPEGIANAVRLADRAVRERATERTAERLRASGATRESLR
jgi:glycerol-3-phosphate acyltransferase PlsX